VCFFVEIHSIHLANRSTIGVLHTSFQQTLRVLEPKSESEFEFAQASVCYKEKKPHNSTQHNTTNIDCI
jgi:hypothetical protein